MTFAGLLEITARVSLLILILLLLRPFLLRLAGPGLVSALWLIPAARLLLPMPLPVLDSLTVQVPWWTEPAFAQTADESGLAAFQVTTSVGQAPSADATSTAAEMPVTPGPTLSTPLIFPALWLGGSVFALGFWLTSLFRTWRVARRTRPCRDQRILNLFEKLPPKIRRGITLRISPDLPVPALCGLIRPAIWLPEEARYSDQELRHIFLHELGHARRADLPASQIINLALCLHWWNPLVWALRKAAIADREMACDAWALSQLTPKESSAYGETLMKIISKLQQTSRATGSPSTPPVGAVSMATSRRHIFARVLAIQRHRSIAGWRQVLACCLLAVLFCLCTATFQATAEPAPAAQNAPPPSEPAENPAAKADLTQMIIPKVSIENGEFMEVISFLSTFARENAPEGQKLEFIVDLPDPSQLPRITVEMKQTSIARAAQYVAKQAGLDAEISEEKIVFRASQPGSQLQSKLDSIQVEKINWLETTLHAAIAYLNAIAYEQDPEEFGVPITIGDEFDRHQTLTLQLKDVSLRRAIQETAARVNAMVGVTGDKVVLVPHNTGQSGSQDTLQVSARFVEMTQSAIEELAAEDDFFTGFSLAKTAEEAEEASLVVGKERLEEIIKMLENHEGVDLLSAPRVVTLVGQPATINITRELSYPDSIKAVGETTQLVPTEFERRNVGITMSVGSERHENGEIHLRIVPEQTYVTGYIQYPEGVQVAEYPADESARDGKVFVPIFANKTINTSAKLKDELHMAMGGLRGVSTTFAAIQGDLAQKGYGPKHPKVLGAEALKDVEEKVLLVFVSIEFQGAEPSSDSDQTRRRRVIRPFVR